MSIGLICFLAVILDGLLGEPRRFHPLVGFGHWANDLEQRLNTDQRWQGILALILGIGPFVLLAWFMDWIIAQSWMIDVILLYFAIAPRSLSEHAWAVQSALKQDDLEQARQRVGLIVSRDTHSLEAEGVTRATIESVLENGNDAIFAALFWYLLAGLPGLILYRLANTLDALWGYRNARFIHFGWAAARLDDVLNWLPARLTAFSYACVGHFTSALGCWFKQGASWYSPNAGPVMAAGAGALQVILGESAYYHGQKKERPVLGMGHIATTNDIGRAVALIHRALGLWLLLIILGEWGLA
jgi:adenosylcobinamide-phosphate synthase